MKDENKVIEATAGPYKGQRLTVSAAEADQAISDGWARDPFAPASDKPAKEQTEEERLAVNEKAEAAGRRLRGEETRDMQAGESRGGYETKEAAKPQAPIAPKRR